MPGSTHRGDGSTGADSLVEGRAGRPVGTSPDRGRTSAPTPAPTSTTTASPTSPAGREPMPPVPSRHLTRAPADGPDLWYRADETWQYASYASAWHDSRASWWDVVDTWGRLLVAVAASLSALSLVAANAAVTAVLAVLTAVVSALSAALGPADRSLRHRRAAKAYRPIARDLAALATEVGVRLAGRHETIMLDGEYRDQLLGGRGLTTEELAEMVAAYQGLVAELDAVDESAPAISHLQGPDSAPRTRWGLRRLQRRLALRQEAMALQARFSEGIPLTADGAERRPAAPSSADGPPSPGAPPARLADLGL